MSLDWGETKNNTSRLDLGTGPDGEVAEMTLVAWVWQGTIAADSFPAIFSSGTANDWRWHIETAGSLTNAMVYIRRHATRDVGADGPNNTLTSGQWSYAAVIDFGTTAGGCEFWTGDESTVVSEVGSYQFREADPAGAVTTTSSQTKLIGSNNSTQGWEGKIAFLAKFDDSLTEQQLKSIQFNPVAGSLAISTLANIWLPGMHGVTNVYDFLGTDDGTAGGTALNIAENPAARLTFPSFARGGAFFTPLALNNDRVSAMHFQRHYEPVAVGV